MENFQKFSEISKSQKLIAFLILRNASSILRSRESVSPLVIFSPKEI